MASFLRARVVRSRSRECWVAAFLSVGAEYGCRRLRSASLRLGVGLPLLWVWLGRSGAASAAGWLCAS
jgi:hypothetical protein